MAEHVVALDLGTTGVRALVVHADGRVLSRAWQPLGVETPAPGRLEQNPDEMWDRSVEVMREALAASGLGAADLGGLGVVNQRSTAIAWTSDTGDALAPALGWQDVRTAERVAELVSIGIPVNTLASCTKFEWLLANDSAVASALRGGRLRFGTPDTWLTEKLTGGAAFVTDPGNAACTGLIDPVGLEWSPGILELFGLEADCFARLVSTAEVVGETPTDLLGAPVPVSARAGDQQAACFAQSVHEPGQSKLTLGTAAMLDVHVGSEYRAAPRGSHGLPLWQLPGTECDYCVEGTVVTAGAVFDWLVSLGLLSATSALDGIVAETKSTGGVFFVPALQGLGTPFIDDGARGLFGGLTRGSDAHHLVRAAAEGVVQRCVDVIDSLAPGGDPLRVDGGVGQSRTVLQLLADLSGREVLRARETETTALGAAFLASLPVGLLGSPAEVQSRVEDPDRFEPTLPSDARKQARREWQRALSRSFESSDAVPG